jgi:phosphohistidine phosphatase
MDLFLIRHAPAASRSGGLADDSRPLLPSSRRKLSFAVRGLGKLGVQFDRLYHSPSLRALETADALAVLVRGETVATTYFAEQTARALLDEIAGERVALVGHDPWLAKLLGQLVFGTPDLGRRCALGKGDVAWLEGQPRRGGMTLRALLPFRTLRRLGRR